MGIALRTPGGCVGHALDQPPLDVRRAVDQPLGAGRRDLPGACHRHPQGRRGHRHPPPDDARVQRAGAAVLPQAPH
eukprot:8983002-Alexandrium_andersonii.AAC.1